MKPIFIQICPNYGWTKMGIPLNHYVKTNPKKYSIIMAISNNKIIHYEIHDRNINSKIFIQFVRTLTKKFNNKYILLDNVSFHKCKQISDILIKNKNRLLFIPPYSPQFNPIEEVFFNNQIIYQKE